MSQQLIERVLCPTLSRYSPSSMQQWQALFIRQSADLANSVERAIIGGRCSRNLAFAFAAGYQSALEAMFGLGAAAPLSSLCVSEAKGNHPRMIETRLSPLGKDYELTGSKSFVSGGTEAEQLYIACHTGSQENGLPALKLVCIPAASDGVLIEANPALPFMPEVSHGKISLQGVKIRAENLLPGDGYLRYIKPFRTYEDLHVLSAVLGFRLGEACEAAWPTDVIEQHLSLCLATRSLAEQALDTPESHLMLAGLRSQIHQLIAQSDALFESHNPAGFALWQRDKPILKMAAKAHQTRTQKAWALLKSKP